VAGLVEPEQLPRREDCGGWRVAVHPGQGLPPTPLGDGRHHVPQGGIEVRGGLHRLAGPGYRGPPRRPRVSDTSALTDGASPDIG
jgi:hypothetical protein